MLRKTTLMAGLATLFISTPVQADEHEITVLPDRILSRDHLCVCW